MQVDICVFDGADELDVTGPFEVLTRAARIHGTWRVRLVALPGRERSVTGQHGLRLHADGELGAAPDILVVPGGGWADRTVGVRTEIERGDLVRAVAEHARSSRILASVCTGAMVLAAAGLLRGVPSTTHHSALDDLKAAGADVVDARVVDAGRIVTAGGVTSGIDLSLWLVERECGSGVADRIADALEYERRGSVHKA